MKNYTNPIAVGLSTIPMFNDIDSLMSGTLKDKGAYWLECEMHSAPDKDGTVRHVSLKPCLFNDTEQGSEAAMASIIMWTTDHDGNDSDKVQVMLTGQLGVELASLWIVGSPGVVKAIAHYAVEQSLGFKQQADSVEKTSAISAVAAEMGLDPGYIVQQAREHRVQHGLDPETPIKSFEFMEL